MIIKDDEIEKNEDMCMDNIDKKYYKIKLQIQKLKLNDNNKKESILKLQDKIEVLQNTIHHQSINKIEIDKNLENKSNEMQKTR